VEATAEAKPGLSGRERDAPVMFCVRVSPELRRRLKLAAFEADESLQRLATEALQAECRRRGV
jgi:predicted HicB family RNase H-like nuclease